MKSGIIWVLFAASVLLLGVGATAAYRETQRLITDLNWVSHTDSVIASIDDLQATLQETTSLADAYVLTGDNSYADALQKVTTTIPTKLSALHGAIADDPTQQFRIDAIDRFSHEHLDKLNQIIPASSAARPGAMRNLRQLDGMLSQSFDSLKTKEAQVLVARENISSKASSTSKLFIASTGVLGMLLLAVAFIGLEHQLKQRRNAEMRLQEINEELGSRISRRVSQLDEVNRNMIMEAVRREEAEQNVQQQREFLRTVIDTNPNLIFVKSWDGKFTLANKALADLYGTTPEEMVGKLDSDFNKNTDELENFRRDDQSVISSRKAKFIPEEPVSEVRTGETHWFQTYKVPLTRSGNSVSQLLGVSNDITLRKLAEEELGRTQQQLAQSQKMEAIGRLAGGLAHDFNNILGVVLGYGEQTLQTLSPEAAERRYVQRMVEAGNRAARLVQQLLAFSRKQVLQPRIINLNSVVVEMKQLLERLAGEDVEISVKLDSNLGSVKADPAQMERVIMNLAVNARDAMPEGGKLILETANAELDASYINRHTAAVAGKYVMLAISDTGVGIDKEIQSKIFDPFFTTKASGKGTGLGLATVYGIVNQSGGYVWVYSEMGKGATFKIYLPLVEAKPEPIFLQPVAFQSPTGSETILVVEDDKLLREFICEVLGSSGYSVLAASNGNEALELVAQHKGAIHLLLTDVVMPGMSGRALSTQLLSAQPKLKVLYMSGYTENAIVHHGVLDRGVQLIQKPFTIGSLARKVREILEEKTSET
ncbi:MAG TPA: ATP-binding protein [Terriglobales bacterium]|jgi:PAS domain S-box-containing protein